MKKILNILIETQSCPDLEQLKELLRLRNEILGGLDKRTYTDEAILDRFNKFYQQNQERILRKEKKFHGTE